MSIKLQPKLTAEIIQGASQWPACKPFGDIPSIFPQANTPILVICDFANGIVILSIVMYVNRILLSLVFFALIESNNPGVSSTWFRSLESSLINLSFAILRNDHENNVANTLVLIWKPKWKQAFSNRG